MIDGKLPLLRRITKTNEADLRWYWIDCLQLNYVCLLVYMHELELGLKKRSVNP